MRTLDFVVIVAGLAAVGAVIWYFFLSGKRSASAVASNGVQEVRIVVKGGYDPGEIRVRAGIPVRLRFDRQDSSSCSEEIVLPDFGIRKFLPSFQETLVDIPAPQPGTYQFTCGMSMLHGTMVAQ
jgi:plastocyanin domain-containing protein